CSLNQLQYSAASYQLTMFTGQSSVGAYPLWIWCSRLLPGKRAAASRSGPWPNGEPANPGLLAPNTASPLWRGPPHPPPPPPPPLVGGGAHLPPRPLPGRQRKTVRDPHLLPLVSFLPLELPRRHDNHSLSLAVDTPVPALRGRTTPVRRVDHLDFPLLLPLP